MKPIYLLSAFLLAPIIGFTQVPTQDEKGKVYLTTFTVFDNFNGGAVSNSPTRTTSFTLGQYAMITSIQTYHWNNGGGTSVLGTIKLYKSDGTIYGPWTAKGIAGYGGVKNAFWIVYPNIELPPGTYHIIDSDLVTWSHNTQSENKGFAKVIAKR